MQWHVCELIQVNFCREGRYGTAGRIELVVENNRCEFPHWVRASHKRFASEHWNAQAASIFWGHATANSVRGACKVGWCLHVSACSFSIPTASTAKFAQSAETPVVIASKTRQSMPGGFVHHGAPRPAAARWRCWSRLQESIKTIALKWKWK